MLNVISKPLIAQLLSFVLVFSPTLAFARSESVGSHKFRPQATKVYNAQLARAAIARGKASKKRKPASVNVKAVSQTVRYKGQDFTITQAPSADGKRVLSQTIAGPNFQEILADENNTGTASVWQLKHDNLEMTATHPYKGSFSHLEIRERRAKAYLTTKMQLNPDLRTYHVVAYRIDPFTVDHDSGSGQGPSAEVHKDPQVSDAQVRLETGLTYQCENELADRSGITELEKLLAELTKKSGAPKQSALTCQINHNQELLLDKSCYEPPFKDPKGKFNSANDISNALAKIFSSTGSANPERYLQCANNHHFAYYSAKMQANFTSEYEKARATLMTPESRDTEDKQNKLTCTPLDKEKNAQGTSSFLETKDIDTADAKSYFKPFRCQDSDTFHDGEFHDDKTQQIVLGMPSDRMSKAYYNSKDASDAYASVIFHEMLHQAGIPEIPIAVGENVVADLQVCCASPPSMPDTKRADACRRVDNRYGRAANFDAARTEIGIYMPGMELMQKSVADMTGAAGSDDFMAHWYSDLQKDPKAKAAYEDLKKCESASGADSAGCVAKANPALTDFNNQFFGKSCSDYIKRQKPGANFNCDKLKAEFDAALKSTTLSVENSKANSLAARTIGAGQDIPFAVLSAKISGGVDNDSALRGQCKKGKCPCDAEFSFDTSGKIQLNFDKIAPSVPELTIAPEDDNAGSTDPTLAANTQSGQSNTAPAVKPKTSTNSQRDARVDSNSGANADSNSDSQVSLDGTTDRPSSQTSDDGGSTTATSTSTPSSANYGSSNYSSKPMSALGGSSLGSPTGVPARSAQGIKNAGGFDNGSPVTSALGSALSAAGRLPVLAGALLSAPLLSAAAPAQAKALAPERLPSSVTNDNRAGGTSGGSGFMAVSTNGPSTTSNATTESKPKKESSPATVDGSSATAEAAAPARASVDKVAADIQRTDDVGQILASLKNLGERNFREHLSLGDQSLEMKVLLAKKWSIVPSAKGGRLLKPPGGGPTCYRPDRARTWRAVSCSDG